MAYLPEALPSAAAVPTRVEERTAREWNAGASAPSGTSREGACGEAVETAGGGGLGGEPSREGKAIGERAGDGRGDAGAGGARAAEGGALRWIATSSATTPPAGEVAVDGAVGAPISSTSR